MTRAGQANRQGQMDTRRRQAAHKSKHKELTDQRPALPQIARPQGTQTELKCSTRGDGATARVVG